MRRRETRGNMSSQGYTIRDGTSEKHWYALAGYIVVMSGLLLYSGWVVASEPGGGDGVLIALLFMAAAVVSAAVAINLFKDSAYVRGTGVWFPKWWYYLGIPSVLGIFGFTGGWIYEDGAIGFVVLIFIFPLAMYFASMVYLFHRHKAVGVP